MQALREEILTMSLMTWGEFKRLMAEKGVTDDTRILIIDVANAESGDDLDVAVDAQGELWVEHREV